MTEIGAADAIDSPTFNRLLGANVTTTAHDYVQGLPLGPAPAGAQRPYTIANFVSSVDGRAMLDGVSQALGDAGDLALLMALRERADALLVGTGTLAGERYGSILPDPEARKRRAAAGRLPSPLVVTVSRTGRVPFDIPLFTEPDARVVIFSPMRVTLPRVAAQVLVELVPDAERALEHGLGVLLTRFGVQLLLCEGGPGLFGALTRAGLNDELFLTLAPKLAGAQGEGSILNPRSAPRRLTELTLADALEHDGSLCLRYQLTR